MAPQFLESLEGRDSRKFYAPSNTLRRHGGYLFAYHASVWKPEQGHTKRDGSAAPWRAESGAHILRCTGIR